MCDAYEFLLGMSTDHSFWLIILGLMGVRWTLLFPDDCIKNLWQNNTFWINCFQPSLICVRNHHNTKIVHRHCGYKLIQPPGIGYVEESLNEWVLILFFFLLLLLHVYSNRKQRQLSVYLKGLLDIHIHEKPLRVRCHFSNRSPTTYKVCLHGENLSKDAYPRTATFSCPVFNICFSYNNHRCLRPKGSS